MLTRRSFIAGSAAALGSKKMVWSNQAPTEIVIPPGAISGERIVINSEGILGYDQNNNLVLQILPNTDLNPATLEPGIIIGEPDNVQMALFSEASNNAAALEFLYKNINPSEGGGLTVQTLPLSNVNPSVEVQLNTGSTSNIPGAEASIILFSQDQGMTQPAQIQFQVADLPAGSYQPLTINPKSVVLSSSTLLQINSGGSFQLGNGLAGGAYSEEVYPPQLLIANNVATQLKGFTLADTQSDYGTKWDLVNGLWVCPVSSYYDFAMQIQFNVGLTGRCYFQAYDRFNNIVYFQSDQPLNANNTITLSGCRYIPVNTELEFILYQSSGAARQMTNAQTIPYLTFSRRLA